MTWGELALRIQKAVPGVDPTLRTSYLASAYEHILNSRAWEGLRARGSLQTALQVNDGTVTVSNGSAVVTGSGTAFTSALVGRAYQTVGRPERYTVAAVDSTTELTLDRTYESPDAAGAAYRILQLRYELPAGVKYPESFQDPRRPLPLDPRSQAEMNLFHPARTLVGDPTMWAPDVDSDESASPVVHAVELYPLPIDGRSIGYVYQKAAAAFTGQNTSASPLPWIDSNAILFAALEQAFLDVEKFEQADRYKLLAADALATLHRTEDQREGAHPLRLHRSLTRHRRLRGRRCFE